MSETNVSPAEETLNPTADTTKETPEVVTPEVEADKPAETPESEADKALRRMQRRIDKRTADVYRERAEKEQLAQRLAALERQLQPEAQQERQPRPEDVLTQAQRIAQETIERQRITDSIGSVLKAGKALENFDQACNTLNEELPFYRADGRPTPFLSAVLEFDAPAKLLHHLGSNPDLAAELADLTPTRLVRRLDAIERDLTDKAKPKTSAAPKPLEPVRASGAGSKDPTEMSQAEFNAWRSKTIKQRNRS